MASAEIITIGTEILLGDIVDTNARWIARCLRDAGIDLYRKTTVGDNPGRIALAIQQALERCDIVITTGGLGPTVDDPTRDAAALAFGVKTEFREELWEQIQARFRRFGRPPTENNRRQAYVPAGAVAVENPVGTAPSFYIESGAKVVFSLPGVPREMEYLMTHAVIPYLRSRYQLHSIIKTRVVHTAGIGESQIDDLIDDLERMSNPSVGLAAHSGQVDVRITAKAESEAAADEMIGELEGEVRRRLGRWIYGTDEETLESAALRALAARGWSLAVVAGSACGELIQRLAAAGGSFLGGEMLPAADELALTSEALLAAAASYRLARNADVGLGVSIRPEEDRQDVIIALITPSESKVFTRPYGGPPEYAPRWAMHHSLDLIRNLS